MRRLVLVVMAACSSSASTPPPPAPTKHTHATPPTIVHAGHSGTIEIVAATDDGRAAVTQDATGGTRLWPALDGTLEPVVVHAVPARELVLGRDGAGFVIAGLDPAGALELVRVGATGATFSRAQIGGDVPVEQIAMTPRGVLALRADQTLVMFDAGGRAAARLVPPVGARITSVVARDGHAIALVSEQAIIHAREITLDPVQWGKQSPPFTVTIARPVLAPDGKHLATQSDTGIQFVDLVTGAVSPKGMCADPGSDVQDGFSGLLQEARRSGAPVGFVDPSTLASVALGRVVWCKLDGTKRPVEHDVLTPETVAVANGLTVMSDRESLVLVSGTTTQYLGYGVTNPNMVRSGPLGITVGHANVQLLLDPALRTRKRYDLPADPRELDDAMPLDNTHVLISRSDTSSGAILHRLAIVDTAARVTTPLPLASTSYELRYEAATHLLAVVEADHTTLVALDLKTLQLGVRSQLAGPAQAVSFTDPALAKGIVAIGARSVDGRLTIDEFAADDLGGIMKPRNSYEVFGDLVAVDRAGRTYVADGDTVHIYTSGEWHNANRVAKLDGLGRVVIRPNSDATQLLVIGDNRLRMFDLDGKQRWLVAAPNAIDGAWIEGEPYVRFSAGLSKLDAQTGTLLDRACGWGFGLSPAPFEAHGDSRSVCDEG